jgi:putative transposase
VPNDRRAYVPGGTVVLTVVTYRRRPTLAGPAAVARLRRALRQVMREAPFAVPAAVVLPDHAHFLWALPRGDADDSRRVGRMNLLFTRALRGPGSARRAPTDSRRRHRESDVWHRRFWGHTIADEDDFERHVDYIHDNPVKHGLVTCPHLWPFSSFGRWVAAGHYPAGWGCCCGARRPAVPAPVDWVAAAGE